MRLKSILFLGVIITAIIFTLVIPTNVFAASTSIAASETNVNVGDSVTISAVINEAASWSLGADVSGGTFSKADSSTDTTSSGENENKTVVIGTFSASTAGTYTVSLTGYVVDLSGETQNKVNATGSIKIKVDDPNENTESGEESGSGNNENAGSNEQQQQQKQEEQKQEEQKQEEQKQEQQTTTQEEEPNFTNVDKTMYTSSSNVNLRNKPSTNTGAVSYSVAEGTEIQITATSTNDINGHVWYKGKYKGQTIYVDSKYLTSTKPEEKEEVKSDNANLKELSIEGIELKPAFGKDVTNYTLEVGNEVNELTIKAEAEDEKASIDIQGNKDLKVGENKIAVTVSAEDGTTKIYEINVTKNEAVALGLKSLTIKGTNIATQFKTNKYNYDITVQDVNKLDIVAVATIDTAKIEILGNENLVDGENIVTIMVKSENGEETVTYQLNVTKNEPVTTIGAETNENSPLDSRVYLYGGICVLALLLLIVLIVFLIKNKAKGAYYTGEEQDEFDDYEGQQNDNNSVEDYKNEFAKDFNDEDNYSTDNNYESNYENNYKNDDNDDNYDNDDDDDGSRRGRGKHF